VRWLSDNAPVTREKIEEACLRFDLPPVDEEFLLTHFVPKTEGDDA
jgi:hypothetical protein